MEKIKIFYKPSVEQYINNLILLLYEQEYFGFLEDAIEYKNRIIDYIEQNISTFPAKPTPFLLRKLGSQYIFYKANQRTTWFIFFEENDNIFLVTHITNNFSEIIKYF
ncbi:MAG: hypothetical protein LBE36_02915 [Flavobacteriaceae bacterium]|nr:hypothetical protein [Flavobacteriaceae bacterium]